MTSDHIFTLQKQPNQWSCLPTAFAIVLNEPVDKIISDIGHDGSEIIFPDLTEPYRRKAFHIQELIDICILRDICVVQVEQQPISEALGHRYLLPTYLPRLEYYTQRFTGVLTGLGPTGRPHAVAWDRNKIYDPTGFEYDIDMFNINMFLLTVKINITK